MMKKIILATMAAMVLAVGVTVVCLWENPSTASMPHLTVEKTFALEANITTVPDAKLGHGDAIFSSSSLLSLCLVVLAIVAFRQNSNVL
ncbi:MAG: hypothetical protein PVI60_00830 [Desulfobacteraceae bacterium]